MSKQAEVNDDRIPSYEESIATSPFPPSPSSKTSSSWGFGSRHHLLQRARQYRIHCISSLSTNHLFPALNAYLEDGITKFVILILPADPVPSNSSLSISSVTSPILSLPTKLLNLQAPLQPSKREGSDYPSTTLIQNIFISDMVTFLHQSPPRSLYPCHKYPVTTNSICASTPTTSKVLASTQSRSPGR